MGKKMKGLYNKPCPNVGCVSYTTSTPENCEFRYSYKNCTVYGETKFKFRNRDKGMKR